MLKNEITRKNKEIILQFSLFCVTKINIEKENREK